MSAASQVCSLQPIKGMELLLLLPHIIPRASRSALQWWLSSALKFPRSALCPCSLQSLSQCNFFTCWWRVGFTLPCPKEMDKVFFSQLCSPVISPLCVHLVFPALFHLSPFPVFANPALPSPDPDNLIPDHISRFILFNTTTHLLCGHPGGSRGKILTKSF